MEWNLTSLVQGWVDRRYPNYGVMLRPTTSVSTEEYTAAEGDSAQVPKLVIKYVAPCGAINPPQDGIGGRVAWWKFNESTGTTAADAIGGHPGSVSGGTWSATGGVSGGALAFNSAGKVSVAHTDDLSQTGDFSLGAWVNLSDPNGKRSILHKGTAANEANYAMGVNDGNLYFEYFANSVWRTYITAGFNLQAGTYYHLTATYKSSTRQIKLYVDGIPAGTFTASFGNTPKSNTKALLIGTTPSNENFLGRIDDVQIVASNLDATGVATLMGGSVRIPAADTHVSAEPSARNFNYGGATLMQLKYPPDIRPLVRFDLSAVPAGTPIKRAILSFHVQDAVIKSSSIKAYAYPLTESWLEGTQNGAVSTLGATWSKRQVGPDLAWSGAGGTFYNVPAGVFQVPLGASPKRYWEMEITSTVQEWVDGVRANHGLTLLLDFSLDSANLSSRESPRLEPRLLISTQ
ncbi:MAG: DNRLRE domain-containing protein [Zoogloea sp.]|nr:DNRLRE domain-containing protein [Zoogloea sp.]